MAETVFVNPELIRWAVERSGLSFAQLAAKFPNLDQWESGQKRPTLKQLEAFAKRTLTPLGYLFLLTPPVETLTIPDFRTLGDRPIDRPSPNLLDTIHDMQRRQQWLRDQLLEQGQEEVPFVGSIKLPVRVEALAVGIQEKLGLESDWAEQCPTWEKALRTMRLAIEEIGIMVSTSGVVGLNNHRQLDPDEFRGFVLCDRYAPLIFVNGADSKSAQMFTLAHELAHIWLGKDGIFNLIRTMPANDETEKLCNRAAAEFLVPAEKLSAKWPEAEATEKPFNKLSLWFKVSPIAVARRALDLQLISKDRFFLVYNQYQQEWQSAKQKKKAAGGDFYLAQDARLGRRFAQAVVQAVRKGELLYHDAYQLTGLKGDTFECYAARCTRHMRE